MAEEKKQPYKKQEEQTETLIRVLGRDIRGSRNVYTGLTRIKGVSWSISNATCKKLGIPKEKKFSDLSKDEIAKIENFIKNLDVPDFMKNRRSDPETGESKHLQGNDLDMRREFDIKKLKKIKSYRGFRHTVGLPTKGQRTRSNFRKKGKKAVGVKRKKK